VAHFRPNDNELRADAQSWIASVRAADEVAANLGEGHKANIIGSNACVPLLEGVREGVRDCDGRKNERDSEVEKLHVK